MPSDQTKLPRVLLASADPQENPFLPDDPRHLAWKTATAKANEAVHRLNARLVDRVPERSTLGFVAGYHEMTLEMVVVKFDIWAQRTINAIWDDESIPSFETWLFTSAEEWLSLVKSEAL